MATVAAPTTNCKPTKVFYAHLFALPGKLTKLGADLVFFGEDDTITTVEIEMINYLCVLGECGVADTQTLMDQLHGGVAAIACSRRQEVR